MEKKVLSKFDRMLATLNEEMKGDYAFTSLERNPALATTTLDGLMVILNDYCALPRVITRLLERARKKALKSNMPKTADELELNLTEERGQDERANPKGVPHYEMLRRGLKKEFCFVPSKNVRHETEEFIQKLTGVIGSESPAVVTGAIYALESSAHPELLVVRRLLEAIADKRGESLAPKEALSLIWFIEIHTDVYELDHESRLKDAILQDLGEDCLADFEQGFREVIDLMEVWWKNMAHLPSQLV